MDAQQKVNAEVRLAALVQRYKSTSRGGIAVADKIKTHDGAIRLQYSDLDALIAMHAGQQVAWYLEKIVEHHAEEGIEAQIAAVREHAVEAGMKHAARSTSVTSNALDEAERQAWVDIYNEFGGRYYR